MRGRAVLLVATLALACSTREDDARSSGTLQGPVLARGRGIVVTESDFRAKLAEPSPLARAYDGKMERKKELLETVIRFELLAKEAEEQGLDKDPEVRAAARRIMVQKLLRKRLEDGTPGTSAAREQRAKLLEEHVRELRERAGVTVDLAALERVDLGEVARPGLRGHSAIDERPAVPPPAR